MYTPWGPSQQIYPIGDDGIKEVSCAGHGGVFVPPHLNAQVHPAWRNANGWYEEDCEYAIPVLTFPAVFNEAKKQHMGGKDIVEEYARPAAKNWFPDAYMTVTGEQLGPDDSSKLKERAFREQHAEDFVACAAWGSWAPTVPEGQVGVWATKGGERTPEVRATGRYFLVPGEEYDQRGQFGFVIDPDRHQDWCGPDNQATTKAVSA